jgi:hypothetical protein
MRMSDKLQFVAGNDKLIKLIGHQLTHYLRFGTGAVRANSAGESLLVLMARVVLTGQAANLSSIPLRRAKEKTK